MITRVQAKNFKSFREIDVELGPLTVFVGRNASGKSNFVDILRFVRDALTKGLDAAITERGGYTAIAFKDGSYQAENFEIIITIKREDFAADYKILIGRSSDESFQVSVEDATMPFVGEVTNLDTGQVMSGDDVSFTIEGGKWKRRSISAPLNALFPGLKDDSNTRLHLSDLANLNSHIRILYSCLTQFDGFSFFPNVFRPPQQYVARQIMDDEGNGFANALGELLKSAQGHRRIVSILSQVVEDVVDIRVQRLGSYLIAEIEHRLQNAQNGSPIQNGTWIDLARESDGTLRLIGLLVGLYQDRRSGRVLAFEEPELSIHIGALQMFYELFEEAALTRQIIVTTHSPDFIAQCKVDELRIVERVNGESKIGRLLESQVKAINDQLFKSSDLIRIEGLRREDEQADGPIEVYA